MKSVNEIVKDYIDDNDIKQARLSKLLGMKQQNMSKKFKSKYWDVDFIKQVSNVLQHNFFDDLSREYDDYAKRQNFDIKKVVNEPLPHYGESEFEKMIRKIVRDEMKKK